MEIVGDLEAHVTVSCPEVQLARLCSWADERGLKVTHVMLAKGLVRSQPMLTLRAHGAAGDLRCRAEELTEELTLSGFAVNRIKIECAPWSQGVPEEPAAGQYFEHHVKLLLEDGPAPLIALVEPHRAHVSHNARRVRPDGRAEWFVTQRVYGGTDTAASALLKGLVEALDGFTIVSVEREFVVHDSNETIDEGWIT